jgi:hypothetical protein
MKVYTAISETSDDEFVIAAWNGLDRKSFVEFVLGRISSEGIPNPDDTTSRLSLCEWEIEVFLKGWTAGSFKEANYADLCWTYPGEWIVLQAGEREPNPFGGGSPLVTEEDLDAYPLGDPKRITLERELEKRRGI